ncbi:MAG: transposase [Bacteroidota bacterium]
MSRKSKHLQSTDCDFHVYNRGVDRQTIFFRAEDYQYFTARMCESLELCAVALLSYCLLPNHFHLVLRQKQPYEISRYMKALCEGYAKAINSRRTRTGHLFGSRFKMARVKDPPSLLRLSHYVHCNPVKAGLVKNPLEWDFSSGRNYVSSETTGFVDCTPILDLVGGPSQYLRFMNEYDPSMPNSARKFILGETPPPCGWPHSS